MNKKTAMLITLFICFVLLFVTFSGCIEKEQKTEEITTPEVKLDQPSILPDWKDGDYHDYYGTIDLLNEFEIKYPDLVNVFSIGNSVLGKDIWCIRITNENNTKSKSSCLIHGCIHGNEWEAGESCLYLAEYLLINFDANETITNILNSSEIYLVPLVNPDARQMDYLSNDSRFNANGMDLNRNFDVDFGRLLGCSMPLGKLFGRIKIPYLLFPRLNKWFPRIFPPWATNCGRHPFSEPETQALRDLMIELRDNDFSFCVDCHGATHCVGIPWGVLKPPFEKSTQEQYIFDYVLDWVVENTEYERADDVSVMDYYASGTAEDWVFKEFRIPSFYFELLSLDYNRLLGETKHDHLVHWMKTTIPFYMYLLVNIDNLREWKTPDIQPILPEGAPPIPLNQNQ